MEVGDTNLKRLKEELREKFLKEMRGLDVTKAPTLCHSSVFSEALMATLFPDNFKMPNTMPYDGKGDLVVYVEVFYVWMDFERILELARC